MHLNKLPSVAKSFVTYCKHCQGEKFHTVLAHLDEERAKVVCDICKKKSTFSLQSQENRKLNKSSLKANSKIKNEISHFEPQSNHTYEKFLKDYESIPSKMYSRNTIYQINDKIDHPKFKIGFVLKILDDRIEVLFEDQIRYLVIK